jgi:hypothetical protein
MLSLERDPEITVLFKETVWQTSKEQQENK